MLLNVQYGTDSLSTTTNSSRLQLKSSRAKKKDCITEFWTYTYFLSVAAFQTKLWDGGRQWHVTRRYGLEKKRRVCNRKHVWWEKERGRKLNKKVATIHNSVKRCKKQPTCQHNDLNIQICCCKSLLIHNSHFLFYLWVLCLLSAHLCFHPPIPPSILYFMSYRCSLVNSPVWWL